VVADIDADGVERVVSELGADVAAGAVGDVTDSAAVAGAVQLAVERFGWLHVAFAKRRRVRQPRAVAEYPEDVFDRVEWPSTSRAPSSSASTRWRRWAIGPGSIVINSSVVGLTSAPGSPRLRHGQARARRLMRTAAQEGAPKASA
jgi:hypothetical protein